jgi:hypothetical protein
LSAQAMAVIGASASNPSFTETVNRFENYISSDCSNMAYNGEKTRDQIKSRYLDIRNALSSPDMYATPQDAMLFDKRIQTYMKAHCLLQREKSNLMTSSQHITANNELILLKNEIGDVNVPNVESNVEIDGKKAEITSDAHALTVSLTDKLLETLPESTGRKGIMLLQQLEDWAQFDGWIQDIQATGYHTTADKPKTRGAIQAEAGLLV